MTIIISDGKKTVRVDPSDFPHEGKLQQYISDHPECLPVYEIDDDASLMVVCREFQTDHGPIDVLGVDASGNIYIIETKLYKNPDKRKIIAQLLDYGASLWQRYGATDEFVSAIDRQLQSKGASLDTSLEEAFDYDEGEGPADTIEAIYRNLQAGRFRFIVLMDHIDDRLKTLISFINTNSQFDIFAVELTYYKHAQADVLIPELFGVQIKAKPPGHPASSSLAWNADKFFVDAKKCLQNDELQAVKRLYEYSADQAADIRWGRRKSIGTFHPKFSQVRVPGKKWWSPYSVNSDGSLWFNMFRAKVKAKGDLLDILLKSLREQEVQGIPDTPIKTKLSIGQWKLQVDKIILAIDNALPQWESIL